MEWVSSWRFGRRFRRRRTRTRQIGRWEAKIIEGRLLGEELRDCEDGGQGVGSERVCGTRLKRVEQAVHERGDLCRPLHLQPREEGARKVLSHLPAAVLEVVRTSEGHTSAQHTCTPHTRHQELPPTKQHNTNDHRPLTTDHSPHIKHHTSHTTQHTLHTTHNTPRTPAHHLRPAPG